MAVKVMITDDHSLIREGLKQPYHFHCKKDFKRCRC